MGQQAALSGILRGQNKPTSRDSYEAMGQQKGQRNESHPAVEPGHVKNSKSRFQTDRKIPSENEGKSSDFTPYGMAVTLILSLDGCFSPRYFSNKTVDVTNDPNWWGELRYNRFVKLKDDSLIN